MRVGVRESRGHPDDRRCLAPPDQVRILGTPKRPRLLDIREIRVCSVGIISALSSFVVL
jgi:hypothetical protein